MYVRTLYCDSTSSDADFNQGGMPSDLLGRSARYPTLSTLVCKSALNIFERLPKQETTTRSLPPTWPETCFCKYTSLTSTKGLRPDD